MQKNRFLQKFISILLALCMTFAVGAVSVFAEPEDEQPYQEEIGGIDQPGDVPDSEEPQDEPVDQPAETPQDTPADTPQEEPQQDSWLDYIYSYEEATSAYEEPEYLGDLPEVSPEQVVEATAVVMPTVAVSDASLFSGIVMWLCVALGIAVIVGVLVSKRTRRRGV